MAADNSTETDRDRDVPVELNSDQIADMKLMTQALERNNDLSDAFGSEGVTYELSQVLFALVKIEERRAKTEAVQK